VRRDAEEDPRVGFSSSSTVKQAERGEDGQPLVAQRPPDILLLDFKLPSLAELEVRRKASKPII